MKILIPTDFSNRGIYLIEKLAHSDLTGFDLLFTHLFYLPDGIQDLLFSTYRVKEYELISKEFCSLYRELMKDKMTAEELHAFPVKFFYGSTMAHFKNFLSANGITCILFSPLKPVEKINSESMNINSIIKKTGLPLINADELEARTPVEKLPRKIKISAERSGISTPAN